MNDHDELNDNAVLTTVQESFSMLPLPAAPSLEAITARGRARRHRRAGVLSLAGAGAGAALVAGLAGGWGSAGAVPQATAAPGHHASPVQLAAFSVVTRADGDTTLTLYPGQVANPAAVRRALAQHGIPALVTAGRFCRTADQPAPGVGEAVVLPHQPATPGAPRPEPRGPGPIVIHGAAIPPGVELSIGYRQGSGEHEISFTLIKTGAPLTCTSLPDTGPHTGD